MSVGQRADLTPIVFVLPSTAYGTSSLSVVVYVVELNGVATNGLLTVMINKDPLINLSFSASATSVGNRPVQNMAWSFDSLSDSNFYILSTSQSVAAGDKLSFGLNGVLTPGATRGVLSLSAVIMNGGPCEMKLSNNADADKIEYFQR